MTIAHNVKIKNNMNAEFPHSNGLLGQHAISLWICWQTVVTISGGITALELARDLPAYHTARVNCSFQQSPITGPQLAYRYSLPSSHASQCSQRAGRDVMNINHDVNDCNLVNF